MITEEARKAMTQGSGKSTQTRALRPAEGLEYLYRDGWDARQKFWDHLLLGWSHSTTLTWHGDQSVV